MTCSVRGSFDKEVQSLKLPEVVGPKISGNEGVVLSAIFGVGEDMVDSPDPWGFLACPVGYFLRQGLRESGEILIWDVVEFREGVVLGEGQIPVDIVAASLVEFEGLLFLLSSLFFRLLTRAFSVGSFRVGCLS